MNEILQIKRKIHKLIETVMTYGVQPSELADNIFLDSYKRISFIKSDGKIIGELVFAEEFGALKTETTLRYYFAGNKVTLIEEETPFGRNILWDRNYKESELINEIVRLMNKNFSPREVESFIKSLPDELSIKIQNLYNNIA